MTRVIPADVATPHAAWGQEWEIRFTGNALSQVEGGAASAEAVRATLSALSAERPLGEQAAATSEGTYVLGDGDGLLTLWPDNDGTHWIIAVGDGSVLRGPTDLDHWRLNRDRLTGLLDHIRIVVPLLDRRVRESGEPGSVGLGAAMLRIARSADAIEVRFQPPPWCSKAEAVRLLAIAAVCVSPAPGWRLMREDNQREISAVMGIRHAEAQSE